MTENEDGIQINFIERLSILVCSLCDCVVSGSKIERHIGLPRHRFLKHNTKSLRSLLLERLSTFRALDLSDVQLPAGLILAVPGLPIFRDGLACEYPASDCKFIVRNMSSLHEHLRRVHGWVNTQPLGKRRTAEERKLVPWKTHVVCQQFVPKGNHSQLFEVFELEGNIRGASPARIDTDLIRAQTYDPLVEAKFQSQMLRQRDKIGSSSMEDRWIEYLEWSVYLAELSRSEMLKLGTSIDEETEPAVHFINERLPSIVDTCIQTFKKKISSFFRFQINKEAGNENATTPFELPSRASAIVWYTEQWSQMIRIVLRLYLHEREREVSLRPNLSEPLLDGPRLPKLGLSRNQRQQTEALLHSIDVLSGQESPTMTMLNPTVSIHPIIAEQEEYHLCPTNWQILQWFICLFEGEYIDTFECPIPCSLAVMGITEDGWARPETFVPKMSAIIKFLRLMILQKNWQACSSIDCDNSSRSLRMTDAITNDISRFMTIDCPTAMYYLLKNRQHGLEILRTTTPLDRGNWCHNILNFGRGQISHGDLQALALHALSKARRVLTEDILFVSDMFDLPKIDWITMQDNQTGTSYGHMFTTDRSNKFSVDPLRWFLTRLKSESTLASSFFHRTDGKYIRQKDVKPARVRIWMEAICKFKEYLLILIYISGGMPVRSQELLNLRFCNDNGNCNRNIFVEDGLMLFCIKYCKDYASSSNYKTVLRYLPLEVGELLLYYLWLVLPNQNRLSVMTGSLRHYSGAMWPLEGDIDERQWTAERMETALEKITNEAIGIKLNIDSYRHIAVAFGRKYLAITPDYEDLHGEDEGFSLVYETRSPASRSQMDPGNYVVDMISATEPAEPMRPIDDLRTSSRTLSERWHELLGFSPTNPPFSP